MRLASFLLDGAPRWGVAEGGALRPVAPALAARWPTLRAALEADALAALAEPGALDAAVPEAAVRFLPPVPDARRVICVGINYPKRHPLGGIADPPLHIILFAKLQGTLVGHGEALEIPPGAAAESFDYEGEIAAVIGKPARAVPAARALGHVAGYTILDDGSVRGWQAHSVHAGKNFHRSGACGPYLVTPEEVPEPDAMELVTRLNGETVQRVRASEMIFPIAEVIAYVSAIHPLEPGDVIATGSPEGSGASRTPPRFLRAGDALAISVSGLGTLETVVGGG